MVQNVWFSNGPPRHATLPFEYQTHILSGIQMNLVFTDGYCTYGSPEVPFITTGSGLGPALLAALFVEPTLNLDSLRLKLLNLVSLSLESGLEESVNDSRRSSDEGEENLETNFVKKYFFCELFKLS